MMIGPVKDLDRNQHSREFFLPFFLSEIVNHLEYFIGVIDYKTVGARRNSVSVGFSKSREQTNLHHYKVLFLYPGF